MTLPTKTNLTIPCPHCTRGTTGPDSNGSYWRCAFCGGTGQLKKEKA